MFSPAERLEKKGFQECLCSVLRLSASGCWQDCTVLNMQKTKQLSCNTFLSNLTILLGEGGTSRQILWTGSHLLTLPSTCNIERPERNKFQVNKLLTLGYQQIHATFNAQKSKHITVLKSWKGQELGKGDIAYRNCLLLFFSSSLAEGISGSIVSCLCTVLMTTSPRLLAHAFDVWKGKQHTLLSFLSLQISLFCKVGWRKNNNTQIRHRMSWL